MKKLEELMNSIGVITEILLMTYRAVLNAGGTEKEAHDIVSAMVAGCCHEIMGE